MRDIFTYKAEEVLKVGRYVLIEDKSNGNICGHFLIRDINKIDISKDCLEGKHESLKNLGLYFQEIENKAR